MFQILKRLTETFNRLSDIVDDNLDNAVQKYRKIKEVLHENK